MKTRTENEVRLFDTAISSCARPVWLVSPSGTAYNLKSAGERKEAMDLWVRDIREEMEIFAGSYEDEAVMMGFLKQLHAA